MWKNLLGLSVLLVSVSLLVSTLSSARASLGPVTSTGSNPLFSSGSYSSGGSSESISAQSGKEIIITDVTISAQYNYDMEIVFTTTSGMEIGRYKAWNYSNYNGNSVIDSHLNSGLRVPENEGLQVQVNGHGSYVYSGYYAHP